jgi:hypothetical protein
LTPCNKMYFSFRPLAMKSYTNAPISFVMWLFFCSPHINNARITGWIFMEFDIGFNTICRYSLIWVKIEQQLTSYVKICMRF